MDKGTPPSLFVNDGSFMERFKQLQQEKEKSGAKDSADVSMSARPAGFMPAASKSVSAASRSRFDAKASDPRNSPHGASVGKLAFSLKQKSKVLTPSRLAAEDEEEKETAARNDSGDLSLKRQKLSPAEAPPRALKQSYIAPPAPVDPTVKKVADRLANFVAKHGRQLEHVTRQKNPGDTPFKFLFDETCTDYKYYEHRLAEEEKVLQQSRENQPSRTVDMSPSMMSKSPSIGEGSTRQKSNYFTPASALYEDNEPKGESTNASHSADPIAMMEFYMKKAAHEESRRKPKMSKDEMPPPPSLQGPSARGHHMGDYIPPEELEKFMASCNDAASQKASREAAEKAKIQADNVGHKLLSKMGWKEGEGLGSSKSGIANPIAAGDVKMNNLGVGAQQPGEVTAEDDIYEQYKKRMMLGYRYRPNPLNNPRKAYY